MSQQEYEVERIINFGYSDGILYYHVKWIGYDDPTEMTWEPYTNLENCQYIIETYFRSLNIPKPPDKDPWYDSKKKSPKRKRSPSQSSKRAEQTERQQEINAFQESMNDHLLTLKNKTIVRNSIPTYIIDEDMSWKYPYCFVRVPKKEAITESFFKVPDPHDYGDHVQLPSIEIHNISKSDGKLFVNIYRAGKIEKIPFDVALLLFPDPLKKYLEEHSQ